MMVSILRSFCEDLLSGAMLDFGDVLTLHQCKCHRDCFSIRIYGRDEMAAGYLAPTSCNGRLRCVATCQLRADCFDWLRKRWAGEVGLVGLEGLELTLQSFADHCWFDFMSNKDTTNIKKHQKIKQNQSKWFKMYFEHFEHILNIFWTYFVQRFLLNAGLSSALGEAGLPSFWGESRGHRRMDAHGWTKERNSEFTLIFVFFVEKECKRNGRRRKEWKE